MNGTKAGIISIEGLFKRFHQSGASTDALADIHLEVFESQFVSLVGPSGCGKSTLLRIIAGLERPSEGRIQFDGESITGPSPSRGMVFQDPNLFPWLSVKKNIAFGPHMKGSAKTDAALINSMIELVGLTSFQDAWPHQLSGGMAQRVALARTLVNQPMALLLDEPLGALDNFTRLAMQDEILRIWEERRTTTVMVTHDIEEALYMSDLVVIMTPRPGKIHRVIKVDLPRPRSRNSEEFLRMRAYVLELFDLAHSVKDVTEYQL